MHTKTAKELTELFSSGKVGALEIATYFLNRIEQENSSLGAFLLVDKEGVLRCAKSLDEKRAKNEPLGRLAAVPIALKDNIQKLGLTTTCASKILENHIAVYDATVTSLLEKEDALIIGKTNLDEFAMGGSGTHSAFGLTKNPWNFDCIPGGSSSGSTAAVAARLCPFALGSDTGGSIRQPAAFTGICGFKPTYGRISRHGLVAFGSSFDQIGPFATNVTDIALIMDVLGVHCDRDSMSLPSPTSLFSDQIKQPLGQCTIGVPWKFLESLSPLIKENFDQAIDVYRSMGAQIIDIDLSILKYGIAVYYVLATAEASANLARFDGVRYGHRSKEAKTIDEIYDLSRKEGFGSEVKSRILLGTFVLSSRSQNTYYDKAQRVRTKVLRAFRSAFSQCDFILHPVAPSTAPGFEGVKDPLDEYLQDLYTVGANLAGLPAISVPSGFDKNNMPMALQIIGPQMKDGLVLQAAYAFEKETSHIKIPPNYVQGGA